jgi:hypothetical protein
MRPAAAVAAAEGVQTINLALGDRSYPIYVGRGLLSDGELLRRHIAGDSCLVITNETIAPLYLQRCALARAAARSDPGQRSEATQAASPLQGGRPAVSRRLAARRHRGAA